MVKSTKDFIDMVLEMAKESGYGCLVMVNGTVGVVEDPCIEDPALEDVKDYIETHWYEKDYEEEPEDE